jgi:hypothetical protein
MKKLIFIISIFFSVFIISVSCEKEETPTRRYTPQPNPAGY